MVHPVVDHVIARRQGNGFEPVMVEGVIRVLAHRVGQLGQYGMRKMATSASRALGSWDMRHPRAS
jgi:hypothetical protein